MRLFRLRPTRRLKLTKGWLAVALIMIATPKEGFTSQIAYQDVSIEDLNNMADLIVEATFEKSSGTRDDETFYFRITDVRKNETSGVAPGKAIIVRPVYDAQNKRADKLRKETGLSESPIINRFPEGIPSPYRNGKHYVLFLKKGSSEKEWEFAALNACMEYGVRDRIIESTERPLCAGRFCFELPSGFQAAGMAFSIFLMDARNPCAAAAIDTSPTVMDIDPLP